MSADWVAGGWQHLAGRSSLTRLNLSGCWVLDDVPAELSTLTALRELELANCHGMKPDSSWQHLAGLRALTLLNLRFCGLEEVPPALAALGPIVKLR